MATKLTQSIQQGIPIPSQRVPCEKRCAKSMQKDQCSLLLFGSSVLAQVDKCPHGKWTVGYCRVMCPIAQAHCFFPCGQLVQPFYVTFFHVGMHCAHAVSFAFCTLFFFCKPLLHVPLLDSHVRRRFQARFSRFEQNISTSMNPWVGWGAIALSNQVSTLVGSS